jgi:outer membrane protein assembly factor BamD
LRRTLLAVVGVAFVFSSVHAEAQGILHRSKKKAAAASTDNSAAPDKILYDRALIDIKKGRHEVGRLNLQTLINTYPDSEYLAKAKLAIADSYYKEGGSANLTQAISGYKDFIVFFPFLPEAPYAQIQVAMTHFKEMEKPDRDRTDAKAAEEEFQTFLAKYPKDPLAPKAEQHLREVQEVLAEGDYQIGYYYYVKGDRRASAGRLLAITKRYPLYSKSDRALWMLGDIFEKSEKKEIASVYYSRIVKDYPLSPLVGDAKGKLVAFGVPVPQADPRALAWMQAEASAPREHETLIKKPMALVHNGPKRELITAAKTGAPQMEAESESLSVGDVLNGGGKTSLAVGVGGSNGATGNTAVVDVATPGSGASGGSTVETGDTAGTAPATAPPDAASGTTTTPEATSGTTTPATDNPPAAATSSDSTATPAAGASPDADAKPADGSTTDPKKESTSKKKKGLKKLIPW